MQLKLDNTHVSHLTAFEPHGNSLMRCWRLDPLCWRSITQRLWFERKRTLPTGSMWLFHSVSCCSWLFAVEFTLVRWQFLVNVSWPCAARFQCILDCLPWVLSSVVSYLPPTTDDWVWPLCWLEQQGAQSSLREEFPVPADFLFRDGMLMYESLWIHILEWNLKIWRASRYFTEWFRNDRNGMEGIEKHRTNGTLCNGEWEYLQSRLALPAWGNGNSPNAGRSSPSPKHVRPFPGRTQVSTVSTTFQFCSNHVRHSTGKQLPRNQLDTT